MAPADLHYQVDIAHWGWSIAWFLWFIGIAGMGSVAYFFVRRAALAYVIFGSLVVGLLFVVSHLGRWWNLPRTLWTMVIERHLQLELVDAGRHLHALGAPHPLGDHRGRPHPLPPALGWLRWTKTLGKPAPTWPRTPCSASAPPCTAAS